MKKSHTIVIAEAGVNHNGSISTAKKMIDVAKEAGADYVKFQTFTANSLVTKAAQKAPYQITKKEKNESQFEMLKRLELDEDSHFELFEYCDKKNIKFLSTAFDLNSIDLLEKLKLEVFKIPSGEITNLPYLRKIGALNKPVIMSTGMSTLDEVSDAINVLVEAGLNKNDLTILHCNTNYPASAEEVNLQAMITIKNEFDIKVGYSDHTLGIEIAIAAVALGASVIEKHFTLDRSLSGPDHIASLDPIELKSMISAIRKIEKSKGNGIKTPTQTELKNILSVRKSIVAKKQIFKGDILSVENLDIKRPGNGLSPMLWDSVIGTKAKNNFNKDDLVNI